MNAALQAIFASDLLKQSLVQKWQILQENTRRNLSQDDDSNIESYEDVLALT